MERNVDLFGTSKRFITSLSDCLKDLNEAKSFAFKSFDYSKINNASDFHEIVNTNIISNDGIDLDFELSPIKLKVVSNINPFAGTIKFRTYKSFKDYISKMGDNLTYIEIPKTEIIFRYTKDRDIKILDGKEFENNNHLLIANYFNNITEYLSKEE